ncbi:Sec1-like family protein [Cavenderia fasciculata]|uniref:Sec1-like family protein n=1 Tax=Cavenderia fasciculata TaxID=261658 RepID=F4QD95_CACFS|nr:Sec1-like family protein [Cavenderia fasciculata]EGG13723.1 Sec1-like family protein [Cavenderia fasciculata]|eukprot:XP_004350427.1 Sec1-like family protein [Cavenderia fasciculata]
MMKSSGPLSANPSSSSSSTSTNLANTSSLSLLPAFSIKDKQIENVNRMLNIKSSHDTKTNWQEVWKVLIFDNYCSTIIAPILTKGALRSQGVTLHLQLHTDRQPIVDVPAIYFVLPTMDNIKRIAEDCKNKLYDSFYINFATKVSTPVLEELANLTIQYDAVSFISKVYDQFLNFISLEKDLFVLNNPMNSYLSFNDPNIQDIKAKENVDTIVDSLFSVLVTMSVIPIIRCPKNTAAELIANELEKRISQHLSNTSSGNLFSSGEAGSMPSYQRPVLILLDRNIDLSVMLHHPWTYQALAHDILDMTLNRVKVDNDSSAAAAATPAAAQKKKLVYDMDSAIDLFWQNNSGAPFPSVAGEVKNQITEYTEQMKQLDQMTNVDVEGESSSTSPKPAATGGIGDMVTQLKEKKRLVDLHTNLATDLMKNIRDRQIDYFFAIEEAIITRSLVDKKELISLLTSPVVGEQGGRGTLADKLRLLIIYFLLTKTVPTGEMEQFEEALTKMGADLSPLEFFKKNKAFNDTMVSIVQNQPAQQSSASIKSAASFMQMFSGSSTVESFTNYFSQGMRSLLPKSKDLFVTRVVESIMDLKNTLDTDYVYLDPKIQNKTNVPRRNTPFKEAIVFVVGGGNYVEYQNLQDWAKKQNKKIIYGTTELLTSKEFIYQTKELNNLNKK